MEDNVLLEILKHTGKIELPEGNPDPALDLFEQGLTSFNSVQVMLAIEERLGMHFPDDLIRRETFQTVPNLRAAIAQMMKENT